MKIVTPSTFTKFISPLDADYASYLQRLNAFGGSISTAHSAAIQAFVATLKSSTLWTNSILLAPLAGNTFNSALVPLKTPLSSASEFTSDTVPAYSTAAGMTFTSGAEVITTKVNALTHLSLTNFAVWAYTPTTNPTAFTFLIGGSSDVTIEMLSANSSALPGINASRTAPISPGSAPTNKNGLYGGISASGGQSLYLQGTQLVTAATATTPLVSNVIQIGRRQSTTLTHATPFSVGFVAVTTALSAGDITAFTNAVNTLMTALGR
jgi:hypothetical protein